MDFRNIEALSFCYLNLFCFSLELLDSAAQCARRGFGNTAVLLENIKKWRESGKSICVYYILYSFDFLMKSFICCFCMFICTGIGACTSPDLLDATVFADTMKSLPDN